MSEWIACTFEVEKETNLHRHELALRWLVVAVRRMSPRSSQGSEYVQRCYISAFGTAGEANALADALTETVENPPPARPARRRF